MVSNALRKAAEQALEVLEGAEDHLAKPHSTAVRYAIDALRAALPAAQPQPVSGRLGPAPCRKCGYNGPGYYQPNTHPCAAPPPPAAEPSEAQDAARYRWLRDKTTERHDFYADVDRWSVAKERGGFGQCYSGERLDAAIDAALDAAAAARKA